MQFSCTLWANCTNRSDFWGPGALGITHNAPIPCAGPRLRQGARLTHFNSLQAARASCVYADTKHTRELERQRSSRVIVLTTHHPPGPLRIRKGRVAAVLPPRCPHARPESRRPPALCSEPTKRCRDTKRVGPNPQRASGSHWLSRMGWHRKRASPGESSLVAARDSTLMRGAPRSTPSRTRARTPNRGRAKAQFLRPNKKSRRAEPRPRFLTLHTLL